MASPATHPLRLGGSYPYDFLETTCAIIEEGLSELPTITVEIVASTKFDGEVELKKLVGETMFVEMNIDDGNKRRFTGICVSIEHMGRRSGVSHLIAEIRPQLWFLTRTTETRIFQQKSVTEIIDEIFGEYGITPNKTLSGSYETREFTVQYNETDLAFLQRLMEQEGIYFFHDYTDTDCQLVLCDDVGTHKPTYPEASIEFQTVDANSKSFTQHIHTWFSSEEAVSGKVSLRDYNFEKPKADIVGTNAVKSGEHSYNQKEVYKYPGRFREASLGGTRARVLMEAEAARHSTWTAEGTSFSLRPGFTFKLTKHPDTSLPKEFLVTRARHLLRPLVEEENMVATHSYLQERGEFDLDEDESYSVKFEVMDKTVPYRAPQTTPWPSIGGIHTAVVTGPSGKEIYTDKYGRIKVQFHWDRLGKKDENTTCWVRVMMPWTGKQWGMLSIPRIGNEVVVQFEEGDPDRPIVVGMLYNGDNMPPYSQPGNMTQTGIKTWSTPKGGGGFNELLFEDKKDAELVRMQAEKDFKQIVKNDAEVEVGLEKKDKGDMKLTVHRNLTETVKTGDHTFKVSTGSQNLSVKKDKDEKIEGKSDLKVKGNVSTVIEQGNQSTKLNMGNSETQLSLGNYSVDAKTGAVEIKALQQIKLSVGGSSVTINMQGVTIKGPMVTIEGQAMTQVKGTMVQVQGNAMLMLKGGITMMN